MKILMAGDCVGRAGRRIVTEKLAALRREYALELIVLNVENAAAGFSITLSTAQELFAAGVDVMTSGNHIFDKKEALELIKQEPRLLRPVNYVPTLPGSGTWTGQVKGVPVAVIENDYVRHLGTRAGPVARFLLKGNRTKRWVRTWYTLTSLRKLKKSALSNRGATEYWQAGKSVAGISRIQPVADIMREFEAALSS